VKMPEETRMRRQPRQARSQQRVDHLLTVAAQVFGEVGYAAATTNAIAASAEISIGSLYQFFPNKEAILDALLERYLDELGQVMFIPEEKLPITLLIDRMLDRLARFHEAHAGFRALFLDANVEHRIHSVLVQLIETIIAAYFPTLGADLCRQTAMAWLGISRGMMMLTEPPYTLPEHTTQAETRLALSGYLRAVLLRAGVPLPEDLAW
jgi:AcrR family transcriptional regulator